MFDGLEGYNGGRLTLPVQTTRGCSYGVCQFCTYPFVEWKYRELSRLPLAETLELAARHGACLSFKDSLVTPTRLEFIANIVDGRVRWSACTKLSRELDGPFLRRLACAGCRTLEIGLETLSPYAQRLVKKKQPWSLFIRVLDAAEEAGIALVVNDITGLPGVDETEDNLWLARVRGALAAHPGLVAKVEHNVFQLERRSPMGERPDWFGLRVTAKWPWSSVMDWERYGRGVTRLTG